MTANRIEDTWMNIALDDLASARVLFKDKKFRTAYFLFQQASEKANKAFAMLAGILTSDQLRDIGHKQMKIYRRSVVEQKEKVNVLLQAISPYPQVVNNEILNFNKLSFHSDDLQKSLSFIDRMQGNDFTSISSVDINYIIRQLEKLENTNFAIPKTFDRKLKKTWHLIADWIAGFETEEALAGKEEILKTLADISQFENISDITKKLILLEADIVFIVYTLYVCGLLTQNHETLTRYPEDDKDPLTIYTYKLPLVKKLPLLIDILEKAIYRLKENHASLQIP